MNDRAPWKMWQKVAAGVVGFIVAMAVLGTIFGSDDKDSAAGKTTQTVTKTVTVSVTATNNTTPSTISTQPPTTDVLVVPPPPIETSVLAPPVTTEDVAVVPLVPPVETTPLPEVPDAPAVYYKNCDAVRAAGAAPIHRGDPGYDDHLDKDGDGEGCGGD